ncbi:protein of unknown function [Burkholderia multivorans]
MKIHKLKAKQDLKALRQVQLAVYAEINWLVDIEPRLARLTAVFTGRQEYPHRYFVAQREPCSFSFQVNAVCANRVRKMENAGSAPVSSTREEDAVLVYSMHANGSISVMLSPHCSEWEHWEKKYYTIAMYESPYDLMGVHGEKRILKHIQLFLEVAKRSMAISPVRNDRFIARLGKRSDRYEAMYSSRAEERRALSNAEVGLGAGLLGGLIASTIMPFLQQLGKDMRDSVADVNRVCSGPGISNQHACEVNYPTYVLDKFFGSLLTTGHLLFAALVLSIVTILLMKRSLRGGQ